MKRILLVLCLVCAEGLIGRALVVVAQNAPPAPEAEMEVVEEEAEEEEERELETDRDAFTPATNTVGAGLTMLETSYSFTDHRGFADGHSFPELLVRYGVGDRFELRLGWNYEVGGTDDREELERESQLLYGFKMALTEQDGWIPRSATIVQGFTPTSGESTITDVVVGYALGWELANKWRLDSSIRYGTEHAGEDGFNEWAPSVVLRMPLNETWHTHIEYFGIYSEGAERNFNHAFISPGANCLITPNLELGVRLGWGLTDDSANFFSNVGVGWRF